MRPKAERPRRVEVSKLGSSDVGTSWPRSASKLATPTPASPGAVRTRRNAGKLLEPRR